MQSIILVILPVFGLIALGFAARKTGYFGEGVGNGLSAYVFGAAVPVMIFRMLAESPAPDASPYALWGAYFGGVVVAWTLASLAVAWGLGGGWRKGVSAGISAGFSNTVLLALPLIYTAFGEAGSVPLSLIISIHMPVLLLAATLLMEAAPGGEKRPVIAVAGAILSSLATNPVIIGIVSGGIWHLFGWPIPTLVGTLLESLAASAVPCALFAMGMELARYGMFGEIRAAIIVVTAKLLVQPLAVFALTRYVFDLPPVWTATAVIVAATPTGVNAFLFASRYQVGAGLASSAIALSTALSAVTVAVWLGFLGVEGP